MSLSSALMMPGESGLFPQRLPPYELEAVREYFLSFGAGLTVTVSYGLFSLLLSSMNTTPFSFENQNFAIL